MQDRIVQIVLNPDADDLEFAEGILEHSTHFSASDLYAAIASRAKAKSAAGWDDSDVREYATAIAALEAIGKVRELHQSVPILGGAMCDTCQDIWPCPTVRAIDGEEKS